MPRILNVTLVLVIAFGVSACKVVKDTPESERAIATDASGDDARTEQRVADTYDSQLVPFVSENAVALEVLIKALPDGLDPAGDAHGYKSSGGAWNFPVKGEGTIVAANVDSRARVAQIDVDGDSVADATIQLGPVIKGTALRDVAPFFNFDDFRDQIEFAKLSRALNDQAKDAISLPDGDIVGKTMSFTGVTALKRANEKIVVTPTSVEVQP